MAIDWIIDTGERAFHFPPTVGNVALCTVPVRLHDSSGSICLEGRVSPRMLDSDDAEAFSLLHEARNEFDLTHITYREARHGWITL